MSLVNRLIGFFNRHQTVVLLAVPLIVAGIVINAFGSRLLVDIYTYFCVSLALVYSLQVFMGNSGILAWTQVGFMGIGAYATGILVTPPGVKEMGVPNMYPALVDLSVPILPAIVIAALVTGLVAVIIGYPLMRLNDFASVITLFAMLVVMHTIMTQWDNVTNGPRTFFGLPQWTTWGIALTTALAMLGLAYWFRESGLGLRLRATRDDRHAAAAIGIDMVFTRYLGFVLSAMMAGLVGGVWSLYITSFSPKAFYMGEMFVLLSMLVIGGSGGVSGATIGAVMVTLSRELLRQLESIINNAHVLSFEVFGLTELVMAVLMVVVLVWRPAGIIGGQELRLPRLGKKKGPAEANGAAS
ncbi:MAG: branched-chain amino acid ABC transporter permease [Coriobacteriia bacterium]|nr:branched-chain amino acid ABC transporter permease [Coriobacteriia bacterium]